MRTRAALFDLDGTLHEKGATLQIVASNLWSKGRLEECGVLPLEWRSVFVELNERRIEKVEVFERLRSRFRLPQLLTDSLRNDFDTNFGQHAVAAVGAREVLENCKKRGILVGMVTNGRDFFQRRKIDGMGFSPLFDAIVTSGAFGVKKPNPEIFKECLRLLGASPSEAIFIGDDLNADIRPARALGMRTGWRSTEVSADADISSESLKEIHDFLLRED